ncbi:YHS domain-containing (seleno)protein [uncultured Paracoccus sp.]|uniref:YHS domain-containing (seleno)protein n=1 Tax=uncultured Paracoccus sp. TaxID=189685 RepID=UPI0025DF35F9|nr:YHS domain-containing (seleno)protein [uncultured Paracoccus sp.]
MKPLLLSLILTSAPVLPAIAQDWAIDGLDAVGFVESGRPVPGRGDISTLWKGQVWHFATEENRSRFESDPRSFAPAFGGLCPVALAEGRHVAGDPRHFLIIGDTLYLVGSSRAARKLQQAPHDILAQAQERWRP